MNKYHFNENFFSIIDTEEKAYWFGFICADGTLRIAENNSHIIRVELARIDRERLVEFTKSLESNHPIHDYMKYSRKSGRWYPVSLVTFSSKNMFYDLSNKSCGANKTYVVKWPSDGIVSPHLKHHFLRGYFDGDGTFNSKTMFSICGNRQFLYDMQTWLIDKCGYRRTKLIFTDIWNLRYGGKKQLSSFYHLIYSDANVWMSRKKDCVFPFIYSPEELLKLGITRRLDNSVIMKMYQNGDPIEEIMSKFNIGRSHIYHTLHNHGLKSRRDKYELIVNKIDEAIKLWQSGIPYKEVCLLTNIGKSSLYREINKRGLHSIPLS